MAPRRGGGGGYSSGSLSDSCPGGFETWYSQASIAFPALYCVVFLVFFFVTGRRARKAKASGLAQFLTYLSLTFAFVHVVLQIVLIALRQCRRIDSINYMAGSIASTWMISLMFYSLFVLILAPICNRVNNGSPPVKIVSIIFLALLGVVMIVYLSINTRLFHGEMTGDHDVEIELLVHSVRLGTAYNAVELVAMLVAAGLILSAMSRAAHLRAKPIFISLVALVVSAVGVGAINLATNITNNYTRSYYWTESAVASYMAQVFLQYFFYSCALLSAVYVWSSDQLDGARFSVPPPPHPPQYPGDMRGV
ncbi:hypothetical protein P168DRAFT_307197 [Aspergillus campestris IBT 28561]|uniref:Integral membrane protein n=1 Tax=Aspergillus campestris (strain IBT 28561) TaxID=1392248 RepID=A0A2I1CSZ0_ASPC2|nr:uncharacterized protein P168DRAFT_307197 [Aspergillus campestris IBT 28561]PKY00731.1 hypothetical protein P168DRAFT_307197 [Aspergillus campestris IBT 28561]